MRIRRNHFGQRRHILEPEIQSLARNGMNAVCRIANQRKAQLYIFARQVEAQGIGPARPTSMDTSQVRAEASRNLGFEFHQRQRKKRISEIFTFRPDERRAVAGHRQNSERPRGQEVFIGGAIVRMFVLDCRDNSPLRI